MTVLRIKGVGEMPLREVRVSFGPYYTNVDRMSLRPRAGQISIGRQGERSRHSHGVNPSDPPWVVEEHPSPAEAFDRLIDHLQRDFGLLPEEIERVRSNIELISG